ncbi:MFS transporter [Coccidioides immitis RS]|uniref:MFS transporter n=1 Tax=Coccidioides immitis (strain RS) TaxID=246410 RepID=J3KAP6_COCIM|nr:MFS transporter [Coccidioides immitis RS]EAS32112.3 MFS transporter [Coccidioides immitis RS]
MDASDGTRPVSRSSYSDGSEEPLIGKVNDEGGFQYPRLSKIRSVLIIASLAGTNLSSSMSHGLITVGIPYIASDLRLPDHLLLWPSSVAATENLSNKYLSHSLASGCCLLIAGALADLVGDRLINIIGTILLAISAFGSAMATSGFSMIGFRLVEGIGVSMCLPTGVSVITRSFPPGRRRNVGFGCLGLSQPLGFSLGMALEGVFATAPNGWRYGFYFCAGIGLGFTVSSILTLPKDYERPNFHWRRVLYDIDWIGALVASACLGIISYICAVLTEDISNLYQVKQIVLILIAMILIPVFVFWMDFQETRGKPVLIPNSLWSNTAFVAISMVVFMTWGVLQGSELFLSLFFQKIQHLSPLETSVNLLPNIFIGIVLNVTTGLIVHAIRVNYLIVLTATLAAVSPLLMAFVDPKWNYWTCAFWAVLLGPVSVDVVFTVAHLLITDIFAPSTHALAGAVFNTIAQLGTSVGLCVIAVVSAAVQHSSNYPKDSPDALISGYRAAFWTCFAMMVTTVIISSVGLRNIRKLGATTTENWS